MPKFAEMDEKVTLFAQMEDRGWTGCPDQQVQRRSGRRLSAGQGLGGRCGGDAAPARLHLDPAASGHRGKLRVPQLRRLGIDPALQGGVQQP